MATYKLKVNLENKRAKALMEYLFNLAKNDSVIQIEREEPEETPNKKTAKAISEAEKGNVKRFDSFEDLMNDLNT